MAEERAIDFLIKADFKKLGWLSVPTLQELRSFAFLVNDDLIAEIVFDEISKKLSKKGV